MNNAPPIAFRQATGRKRVREGATEREGKEREQERERRERMTEIASAGRGGTQGRAESRVYVPEQNATTRRRGPGDGERDESAARCEVSEENGGESDGRALRVSAPIKSAGG